MATIMLAYQVCNHFVLIDVTDLLQSILRLTLKLRALWGGKYVAILITLFSKWFDNLKYERLL